MRAELEEARQYGIRSRHAAKLARLRQRDDQGSAPDRTPGDDPPPAA